MGCGRMMQEERTYRQMQEREGDREREEDGFP